MTWRIAGAVLAGWLMVGVLVVLTDLVLARAFPAEYVQGKIPPDKLTALVLATSTLYSVIGGWLTARIALPETGWKSILGLVIWGEIAGIASTVFSWGLMQWWYSIGLLVLWIPAVLLGGFIRLRKP